MMLARLTPFSARGAVNAPTGNSAAHRLLILAALCPEECLVYLDSVNDDIRATLSCLKALGCAWTEENGRHAAGVVCPDPAVPTKRFASSAGAAAATAAQRQSAGTRYTRKRSAIMFSGKFDV